MEELNNPQYLVEIFMGQQKLLEHYIKIEGMPTYPIDVSTKKNQTLMKDFISRGIEELSEAHECYKLFYIILSRNEPHKAIEYANNFIEELSDALHFFVEALIYTGLSPVDIHSFIQKFQEDHIPPSIKDSRYIEPSIYLYTVANNLLWVDYEKPRNPFRLYLGDWELYLEVNKTMVKDQARLMWEITHQFKLATNSLKNRPWYTQERESNIEKFEMQMVLGFEALFMLFVYHNITLDKVLKIYNFKNQINLQRITKNE